MKHFATFILDRNQKIYVAIAVERIIQTTCVSKALQPLPGAIEFLEGVMDLNGEPLPVVNLKKRLGLPSTGWDASSKVAVIMLFERPFGILFDDIQEVMGVEDHGIVPIHAALQPPNPIFSHLIKPEGRPHHFNLLDLGTLFRQDEATRAAMLEGMRPIEPSAPRPQASFVLFSCGSQRYGIPVSNSRELTFTSELDTAFKSHLFAGAIHLRTETIPIFKSHRLLLGQSADVPLPEMGRILILTTETAVSGMVVDEVHELARVFVDEILPMPDGTAAHTRGIYSTPGKPDTLILDIPNLLGPHAEEILAVANLNEKAPIKETVQRDTHQHLITEKGYLVFSIGKKFAVELRHIQEIIDEHAVLATPDSRGYKSGFINLRGRVIPVVNLRYFYGFTEDRESTPDKKLIICTVDAHCIALEVDTIITISKQEKYYAAPSLRRELAAKRDTLDRLINFYTDTGESLHALAVNIPILIKNHLAHKGE